MLLSNQTDIDGVTPMPTDRVDDTSVVLPVTSETLTWFYLSGTAWASATGQAAGTIVYGKTVYDGILNSSKSALGSNADTSVSFGAATRVSQRINVPSGVLSKIERMAPVNQRTAMLALLTTAGDYIVDHRRGRVWANMKATVADDSISYSVKSTASGGSTGDAVNVVKVGGAAVPVDDTAYAGGQALMPPMAAVADETTPDSVDEGDAGYLRMTLTRFLKTSMGDLLSGEDQTNALFQMALKPIAVSTYTPDSDVSAALEASSVTKAAAGVLYGIPSFSNTNAAGRWLQFFNSTTVPADTAVPVLEYYVAAESTLPPVWFPHGIYFSTGIAWCNSTTNGVKTVGSGDSLAWVSYK